MTNESSEEFEEQEWKLEKNEYRKKVEMMGWERERAHREMKVPKNLRNRNGSWRKRNIRRKKKMIGYDL